MNKVIVAIVLLSGISLAHAQERAPRDQSLKAAAQLAVDIKQMLDTPIATDPDLKWVVAIHSGERGALVLPECRLSADVLARAGNEPIPIGQLWLLKVALLRDGQAVKETELKLVSLVGDAQARVVSLHALAVQKDAQGKLELLVFGKDKQPLLRAAIKTKDAPVQRDEPIDLSVVVQGNTGTITLDILGRYEASLSAGESQPN